MTKPGTMRWKIVLSKKPRARECDERRRRLRRGLRLQGDDERAAARLEGQCPVPGRIEPGRRRRAARRRARLRLGGVRAAGRRSPLLFAPRPHRPRRVSATQIDTTARPRRIVYRVRGQRDRVREVHEPEGDPADAVSLHLVLDRRATPSTAPAPSTAARGSAPTRSGKPSRSSEALIARPSAPSTPRAAARRAGSSSRCSCGCARRRPAARTSRSRAAG